LDAKQKNTKSQTVKLMPKIQIITEIKSTLEICFDLARSIDLHKISTSKTKEEAIAGTTKGLINLNETVTWKATHFGIRQKLTTQITAFDRPNYFRDEQIDGIFKSMVHEHRFEEHDGRVIMTDVFEFESPLGILGRIFNTLVLTRYMTKFLKDRNKIIKEYAETGKWKGILDGKQGLA
jgi:ligand-binding SRPBCC domain-containing protein